MFEVAGSTSVRNLGLRDMIVPHLPVLSAAACLLLLPYLLAGFAPEWTQVKLVSLSETQLALLTTVFCLPYVLIAIPFGAFSWRWTFFYVCLGPLVTSLMAQARRIDPAQRGAWQDLLVLATLGLAVDLRWLERAWPPHLAVFNKILLLDVGILGFTGARRLQGVGFNLRLRGRELAQGGREFAFYAPIAIALGLALGFLHVHRGWPRLISIAEAALFTFFFIAVPEELFFRGWCQNLLQRRLGRTPALLLTACIFGLSHFNKRAVHFNWRYVLLAAIAGIFYGRAWRREHRVGTSAVTHTLVDTVWSLTLR